MDTARAPFRHEAVFYEGIDDFVDQISAFLRDGIERGERALVVVSAGKIAKLKEALGPSAELVAFADMAEVGLNPARIIPAWRDFVDEHTGSGRRFRGVGEPIWAERTPAELVECHRHEALLNVAFADSEAFWLVCPYDTTALAEAVLDDARRSHPYVSTGVGDDGAPSATYSGTDELSKPFAAPLPAPPQDAETLRISTSTLPDIRRMVARRAKAAGFDRTQECDMVFVTNEIATNTLRHGGGEGVFRIWDDGNALVSETNDTGRIVHAMVGRERPGGSESGGLGLWIANQLCDLVQIRTFDDGSVVRLRMSRRTQTG